MPADRYPSCDAHLLDRFEIRAECLQRLGDESGQPMFGKADQFRDPRHRLRSPVFQSETQSECPALEIGESGETARKCLTEDSLLNYEFRIRGIGIGNEVTELGSIIPDRSLQSDSDTHRQSLFDFSRTDSGLLGDLRRRG